MRSRIVSGVVFLAACALAPACIVEAPGAPQSGRSSSTGGLSPAAQLNDAPPVKLQNGANLEDKVEIVGAQFDPGRITPGQNVEATVWFKVLAEIPQDYLVFVHVEDVDGKMERINVDHPPAGGVRPTTDWKPGETIVDTFNIAVPANIASLRGINVWLGFWHAATDTRLQLKNPERVRNDGRNRILVGTLQAAR